MFTIQRCSPKRIGNILIVPLPLQNVFTAQQKYQTDWPNSFKLLTVWSVLTFPANLSFFHFADIVTTIGEACVCVCAKFDQFLPVRPHFDTKRPVNFFHIATFPSPTFGPLFAFHCPLFFTKNNNLHAAMF